MITEMVEASVRAAGSARCFLHVHGVGSVAGQTTYQLQMFL